jgi:hypothetical protein
VSEVWIPENGFANMEIRVPVQLWLAVQVSTEVPHHFAVGTPQVPSGTLVIGTSLSIVGFVGSFNVPLNHFPITTNL